MPELDANSVAFLANKLRQIPTPDTPTPGLRVPRSILGPDEIMVKNMSGSDQPIYAPMGMDAYNLYGDPPYIHGAIRQPAWGYTPLFDSFFCRWGVLQEPLAAGKVGRLKVRGITPARILGGITSSTGSVELGVATPGLVVTRSGGSVRFFTGAFFDNIGSPIDVTDSSGVSYVLIDLVQTPNYREPTETHTAPTGTSTWTVPEGVSRIIVQIIGGGQAGISYSANSSSSLSDPQGGSIEVQSGYKVAGYGSSGETMIAHLTVKAGDTLSLTVGAGGQFSSSGGQTGSGSSIGSPFNYGQNLEAAGGGYTITSFHYDIGQTVVNKYLWKMSIPGTAGQSGITSITTASGGVENIVGTSYGHNFSAAPGGGGSTNGNGQDGTIIINY